MNRTFNDLIYELLRKAEKEYDDAHRIREWMPSQGILDNWCDTTKRLLEIRKIAHENGVY